MSLHGLWLRPHFSHYWSQHFNKINNKSAVLSGHLTYKVLKPAFLVPNWSSGPGHASYPACGTNTALLGPPTHPQGFLSAAWLPSVGVLRACPVFYLCILGN